MRSFHIHPTSSERLAELFAPANAALMTLFQNWPEDKVRALTDLINEASKTVQHATDALAETETKSKGTGS